MITSLLVPLQLAVLAAAAPGTISHTKVAPAAISSVRYEFSSKQEAGGAAPMLVMRGTVTSSGKHFHRFEILESDLPSAFNIIPVGSYSVSADGDEHTYVVDPAKREYYELNFEEAFGDSIMKFFDKMTDAEERGSLTTKNLEPEVTDLGDGDVILGYRTHHWRSHKTSQIRMGAKNNSVTVVSEVTTDSFYANDLPDLAGPMGSDAATNDKQNSGKLRPPSGYPLRRIEETVTIIGFMKTQATKTDEITKIGRVEVDPAFYRAPKDFKLVKMPGFELPSDVKKTP